MRNVGVWAAVAFTRCRYRDWDNRHLIAAFYSVIDPEGMKGWVGLVGWHCCFNINHKVPSQFLSQEQPLVNDDRLWSVWIHLTDGLLSTQTQTNPDSFSTQVQGTENGPVIGTNAKLHHQLYILLIELVYDSVSAKLSSSNCMKRRKHHHHHL